MNLNEEIKFIEESKKKNYLFISPRVIQGGATLVSDYETLDLYKSMDDNTLEFAKKEIIDLITSANSNKEKTNSYLDFNLIFCGDFNDLPSDLGNPIDFIINNKDKIVAVYRYIKDTEYRKSFISFEQIETVYKYGYIYLNFAKLLEEFDKNNIEYKIDTSNDRYIPGIYRDNTSTRFVISYNPKKENKHQLKKIMPQ